MTRTVLALFCVAALLAQPSPKAAQARSKTPRRPRLVLARAEKGEAGKPDEGESEEGESGEEGPGGGEAGLVPLADLVKDGFVIRTADFIPADAVTRQSGKVSADAMLITIAACTVQR